MSDFGLLAHGIQGMKGRWWVESLQVVKEVALLEL